MSKKTFPAIPICMQQHGNMANPLTFVFRIFCFHFPFWIFDSIRFDSILNYPHWIFDRFYLSLRLPAKCSTWDLSSVSIRNLFSLVFFINIPDSLPIRFIGYLSFGGSGLTSYYIFVFYAVVFSSTASLLTTCALFKHPRSEHISICSIAIVPAHVPVASNTLPQLVFVLCLP